MATFLCRAKRQVDYADIRNLPCIMPFGEGFLPTLTLNHSLRRRYLGRLSYSIIDFRGIRRLRCNSFSALHRPKGFYPITHSLGDTPGLFLLRWSEPKVVGYRATLSSLRKACLVRVRHCVAHRTSATALDFARCRHGKMFALSSDVPLLLIFKVLPLSPL